MYTILPTYDFDFDTVADSNGLILVDKEINLPVSVTILHFKIETSTSCFNRFHRTEVIVNQTIYINSEIMDCSRTEFDQDLSVDRGITKIHITIYNFDPNEIIRGFGSVDYRFNLFD